MKALALAAALGSPSPRLAPPAPSHALRTPALALAAPVAPSLRPALAQLRASAAAEASPAPVPEPAGRFLSRRLPIAPASAIAMAELTEILPGVFHLHFPTEHLLASTFVRFQEHYESPNPRFRGKAFTLEQFMDWYAANQSKDGHFSYFQDWGGFNVPSRVLTPFYEGKFDPLTEKEKALLDLFRGRPHPFYVIGTFGEELDQDTLAHEAGHGLYATSADYRRRAQEILAGADLTDVYAKLRSIGYDDSVLLDEAHAYLKGKSDLEWLGVALTPDLARRRTRLIALYREYAPERF